MEEALKSLEDPLANLSRTGVPLWVMVTLAVLMFGAWSLTYVIVIVKGFRDKTYGIPFPNSCLNFAWEFIFAFDLTGGLPAFVFPLRLGHFAWLAPDAVILYQTWKFGPSMQRPTWLKEHFRWVFVSVFAVCFLIISTYHVYAHDVFGVASSWIINVLMSWLFIRMLLDRKTRIAENGTIQGMSVPAAWCKLIGNAAGAIFCVFWWPAQFSNGALVQAGVTIAEPESYVFLYVLYVVNIALDIVLIYLLREREAEIRAGREPAQDYAFRLA